MALRFSNTLTLQVEEFAPAGDNTVRMYTCVPTVYNHAHIGNFRSFTFYDILRRWLRLSGFQLDHVMNITDVDDKIIRNAVAEKKSLAEYTAIYEKAFLDDCASLRLERPERLERASMSTSTRKLTPATSCYGKRRRKASPPGRPSSDPDAPAGTSNVPSWR